MKWLGGADEPLAVKLPIATVPSDSNKLARPALALDNLMGAPNPVETIGTRCVAGPNLGAEPGPIVASSGPFVGRPSSMGARRGPTGQRPAARPPWMPARKCLASATNRTSKGTLAMR